MRKTRWFLCLLLALALGYGGAKLLRAHLEFGRAVRDAPFKRDSKRAITSIPAGSAPEEEPQAPKGSEESALTIKAFDLVSGEPVDGVSAALILAQTRSDVAVEGNSVTIGGPFPATLVLELRAEGYLGLDLSPAEIPPGEADVHLVPRAGLILRLIDEDSRQPVPSAEITVFHGAGRETRVVSGEDGTAEIEDLVVQRSREPPDDTTTDYQFRVEVTADGYLRKFTSLHVRREGTWHRVELLLAPAVVLRGLVRDRENGAGIPDATVLCEWDFGFMRRVNPLASHEQFSTDDLGEFLLPVRRGGTGLEVVVGHKAYCPRGLLIERLPEPREPSRPGEPDFVIEMETGYEVRGVVRDEVGEPVARVMVDIDLVNGEEVTDWVRFASLQAFRVIPDLAWTNEEGEFLFPRVPRP